MSLDHDYRSELHADHLARRQRMSVSIESVSRAEHQRAIDEVTRLRQMLREIRGKLAASQAAEHAGRGRVASLSKALHELQSYSIDADLEPAARCRSILRSVCRKHGCTMTELRSERRILAAVRQEAFYRLSTETRMSLPRIGQIMRRDHTTVLHGIRAHAARNGLFNPSPCKGTKARRFER